MFELREQSKLLNEIESQRINESTDKIRVVAREESC